MIGIKIADGTYFPILQESEKKKKRVILTTVKDEQPAVQIDLYRGQGNEMKEPSYIGSLMIDNINPAPSGDPEIELLMGIDEDGNLSSKARDIKSQEEQSLSVSLAALPKEETYDMPDFEVTEPAEEASGTAARAKEDSYETPYFAYNGASAEAAGTEKNHKPLIIMAVIGVLAVIALVFVVFFLPKAEEKAAVETKPAVQEQAKKAEPIPEKRPEPVQTKPAEPVKAAEKAGPQKPEQILKKPESIGVWYSTVKGDNLWNLSHSFYRDPWLYKKIAEQNGISNPNLIQQDARLYIPDVETGRH